MTARPSNRRVLFLVRGKLGDTLTAYASVRAFADRHPDWDVALLTRTDYARLLEGEAGVRGGPAGDLYIFLSIKPHDFFQRDGADIFCRVPISMTTAALGGQIDVPAIDGEKSRVKVPEGTESGKQFRLKGKGMPVLRSKVTGDMYIQVEVETPKNLTRKQRDLLEAFERESNRETSPHSSGFFSKVKEFFEGKAT